jgi:hypothetical protein
MGYQVYLVGKRYGGYGVPAYCEHPNCNEEIDRGMSYACAGEPFSELGCDRYLCSKHLKYECWKQDGTADKCDHEGKCACACVEVCERCAKGEPPFDYKPEHPTWVKHVLTDKSWALWRKENPEEVQELCKASL